MQRYQLQPIRNWTKFCQGCLGSLQDSPEDSAVGLLELGSSLDRYGRYLLHLYGATRLDLIKLFSKSRAERGS